LKNLLDQHDRRKTTIPKLKLLRRHVEQEKNEEEVTESQVNDAGVQHNHPRRVRGPTSKILILTTEVSSKKLVEEVRRHPKRPLKENISRERTIESKKKNVKLAMLKSIGKSCFFND
jgi:hypothetical protein